MPQLWSDSSCKNDDKMPFPFPTVNQRWSLQKSSKIMTFQDHPEQENGSFMKLSGTSDLSHSTIYEAHIPSINIVQGKFS